MRMIPSSGRAIAVALVFGSSALLAACGAEQGASVEATEGTSLHALISGVPVPNVSDDDEGDDEGDDDSGDDSSRECDAIRSKVRKDAFAMQRTAEFKAVSKTKEFKQMLKTMKALREAGCKLNAVKGDGNAFECFRLKLQAYQDQQALMKTKQFKKLEKTSEYKKLMKDAQEAQQQGCLDDMQAAPELMIML